MKRLKTGNNRPRRRSLLTGAALGVLTLLIFGAGTVFGAEANKETSKDPAAETRKGWVVDYEAGIYRYYGDDGEMWTNAVTPDNYYVDRNGVMIPPQYEIEKLKGIPEDAKSLLVIEGHGNGGRATFYVKEEKAVQEDRKAADTANSAPRAAARAKSTTGGAKTVSRQAPGQTAAEAGNTASSLSVQSTAPGPAQTGASQKTEVSWKQVLNTNATLGRLGIGKEVEGDEKTPRGFYTLDTAFGTEPDPGNFQVPYLQVHDGHYWVGDSESSYYNQMVDIQKTGEVFDKEKSEHLSTIAGIGYHYCMSVGYNKDCTPHKGSAIFLHCIEGPYTAGCIGIPKEDMVKLLETIQQPAYIFIEDGENFRNY